MRWGLIIAVTTTFAWAICRDGRGEDGRFVLNGKPAEVGIVRITGDGKTASPGDVVMVGWSRFVLGEAAQYEFATNDNDRDTLWLVEGGKRRPVAVAAGERYQSEDKKEGLFQKLTDQELGGLWAVTVRSWDAKIAAKLEKLDPQKTLVIFEAGAASGNRQKLPETACRFACVAVEQNSSPGLSDLSALARAKDLLYLDVRLMGIGDDGGLDPAWLASSGRLRYLRLWGIKDRPWPAGEFAALHTLDLSFNDELTEIGFVRRMPSLEVLRLDRTGVKDLSPAESLARLRELHADGAPLEKLPGKEMKSLKLARLMGTQPIDEQVARFSKLNPQAEVWNHWKDALLKAAKEVSRLRVRTGGTCHRMPAREKTLAEVKEPEKIRGLLELIEVDEARSGFHCMCCGSPSIEFYAGERLALTLGYHHAKSLRWPDGWPGDAALTQRSVIALAKWMADQGVKGPEEEQQKNDLRREAAMARQRVYAEMLPPKVLEALREARDDAGAQKAFVDGVPDPAERGALALRMLGVSDYDFRSHDQLAQLMSDRVLKELTSEQLLSAVRKIKADDEFGKRGAARHLLGQRYGASIKPADLDEVVGGFAEAGLTHPFFENRKECMESLAEMATPHATEELRRVLAGKYTARPAPKGEDPGGTYITRGRRELAKGTTDAIVAAELLGHLKDKQSLPAILKLRESASAKDRELIEAAIGKLK